MTITITSTNQFTSLDGVPVRVWEGVTGEGARCLVFVHRLAVHDSEDSSRFDRELQEQLPPGQAVPLSRILI